MCSITLQRIHVKEMGLELDGSVLSPFLNKGRLAPFSNLRVVFRFAGFSQTRGILQEQSPSLTVLRLMA